MATSRYTPPRLNQGKPANQKNQAPIPQPTGPSNQMYQRGPYGHLLDGTGLLTTLTQSGGGPSAWGPWPGPRLAPSSHHSSTHRRKRSNINHLTDVYQT